MLINNAEFGKRIGHGGNLMNRLSSLRTEKRTEGISLFTGSASEKPASEKSLPFAFLQKNKPTVKESPAFELVDPVNKEDSPSQEVLSDEELKSELIERNAVGLLNESVTALREQVPSASIRSLPSIVTAAAKLVDTISRAKVEANKERRETSIHYHIYSPGTKNLADYGDIIEA